MILIEATIKYKGYNPDDLKPQSNKRVCKSCDQCGRVGYIEYYQYKPLCFSCSISGKRNHFYGKKHSIKSRIQNSCIHQEISIEEFNGFCKDKKYCSKFNNSLKEKIRNKYNRKCFICDKDEFKNKYRLSIHHVDMDKMCGCNNNECILIPLCISCHRKVHNDLCKNRLKYLISIGTKMG